MNVRKAKNRHGDDLVMVQVPFRHKDLFKDTIGVYAAWDRNNREWGVLSTPEVQANLAHYQALQGAVTHDPIELYEQRKRAHRIRVAVPELGRRPWVVEEGLRWVDRKRRTHRVLQRARTAVAEEASQRVVDMERFREAQEEELASPPWLPGDEVPIRAHQLDTGYGRLTIAGPEDSDDYGLRAHYLVCYEPHRQVSGLARQFFVVHGSEEWHILTNLLRRGEQQIVEALSEGKADRAGGCRVVNSSQASVKGELLLGVRMSQASLSVMLPHTPTLAHTAGYQPVSTLYCAEGLSELKALVTSLAQADLEDESSICVERAEPGRWLVGASELREALKPAPTWIGEHGLDNRRASYAHAFVWVDHALDRIASETT